MKVKLLVCLSAAALPALAQGWAQEPSAVAGIPLGADVASLKQCVIGDYGRSGVVCIAPPVIAGPNDRFRAVHGMPDLGFPYTTTVSLYKGRVTTLTLNTKHIHWEQLKAALLSRYGGPTETTSRTVQTLAGASFTAATLTWRGAAIELVAFERATKVNESAAMFTDNVLFEAQNQERSNKSTEGAKKL